MSLTAEEIKEYSKKVALGMSNQQIRDYVIASHVTNDRQFKQALLEIEQREHNRKKMEIGKRKKWCKPKCGFPFQKIFRKVHIRYVFWRLIVSTKKF